MLERAKGIEPSYAAWEAAVLPLNYARKINDLARVARPNVLQNVLHFPLALVRRFRAKGKPRLPGLSSHAQITEALPGWRRHR